jgi:uncharacterized protein YbjT (DUF2867 family)
VTSAVGSLVLVSGGSGTLGRALVPRLVGAGYRARVLSRHPAAVGHPACEWAVGDLASGAGLSEALAGVSAILHLASSSGNDTEEVDVRGSARLIELARPAGVQHLVYISIVGIERIPLDYYRHKLAAERVIQQGGLPWSILRTTQFHELIDAVLHQAIAPERTVGLPIDADSVFQPIDVATVADALIESLSNDRRGPLPDLGGPEVRTLGDLAREWLRVRGLGQAVVLAPRSGPVADGYHRGFNTVPERRRGPSWSNWLQRVYCSQAEQPSPH